MDNKQKAAIAIVVAGILALSVLIYANKHSAPPSGGPMAGAAGNLLAENYDPYIRDNGGFNTGLPLTSSGGQLFSGNLLNTGTEQIGSAGTALSNIVVASAATGCTVIADNSISASSTGYAFATGCTGITSTDQVFAQVSTSTFGFAYPDSWEIISAKASTTAGKIDIEYFNNSGTSRAPSAASRTASSTIFLGIH